MDQSLTKSLTRFQPRWSIGTVLTVSMVLTIAMLMAVTTLLDVRRQKAIFENNLGANGLAMLNMLNSVATDSPGELNAQEVSEMVAVVRSQPDVSFLRIYSADKDLLDGFDRKEVSTYSDSSFVPVFDGDGPVISYSEGRLELSGPIGDETGTVGFVQYTFETSSLQQDLRRIAIQKLIQTLALIAVGIPISYLIARHFTHPIRRLARAAQSVGKGDLLVKDRKDILRKDEFGDLARAFSDMTEALSESREQLEQALMEEHKKAFHLQSLKDIAEQGLQDRPRDELLTSLLKIIVAAHDADSASVHLFDEEKRVLRSVALVGMGFNDLRPGTYRIGEGIVGKVLLDRTSLIVEDIPSSDIVVNPTLKERGIKTVVSTPLIVQDRALGVVTLHFKTARTADDFELSVTELMAESIAHVLERVRLLETERKQAADLAEANEANVSMMRDLELAQQRNLQSAKMAAVGQLAGGVAHEINNPLASILGFAQLGKQKLLADMGNLSEEHNLAYLERYLGYIDNEARRCARIVSKMLSYTQSPEQQMVPTDINQLLEQAIRTNINNMATAGVKPALDLADDLPSVQGHPASLVQAFSNVISNAVVAMPDGGTLKIRSQLVGGRGGPLSSIEVRFQDSGHGMDAETASKVFDPFFTTAEPGRGTGLGMYMCYQIVQQHEGDIEITSSEFEGTLVAIRFHSLEQERIESGPDDVRGEPSGVAH
ncbi:MAG: HAMP domain-containing protein [Chloroflexi bacterium]|nr:HAMP domain-containing protein [Chloroflexota bacterium]